ncbi:glycogen debranching protein GlgX [Propionivibrio sp.]|uniref:glycogen debranching protein GlgX n=1 Tax=Propionivibrio sp. TaxID=2212460 RepID=UPI003BF1167E
MSTRIDHYPTEEIAGWKVRPGRVIPYGPTLVNGGVNFSIFSSVASACSLLLFDKDSGEALPEISLPASFRIGDVWAVTVFELDPERFTYGFRIEGPNDPKAGHRCDPEAILLDPRARAITGRDRWGATPDHGDPYPYRALLVPEDFDWRGDQAPDIAACDLVIYEMHVRGFTRHPSSAANHAGTYAGLVECIPHLLKLGINCVELLPVFEFDEFEQSRPNPLTGSINLNYWGYSTVGFFAPKAGYAATGSAGMQCDEFKTMVRALHAAGIEVILDVVFNHTCEGDHRGPSISFRGLDNKTYYMLTPEGYYYNFSGCGNSLNCNHPVVRSMVLECLRYWVSEYHIDGFRFDAAAILGRDPWGGPMKNPPLLESAAADPVLKKCKLIAEAWDAGGLYLLGNFPNYGRFAEWNGKFRDEVREFLRGEPACAGNLATRLVGSPDLYELSGRGPLASVNFITCHDGFTLRDLVSYNIKHNEANDEGNRDGNDDNRSWNCGIEGDSDDPDITALRLRQTKNALLALFVARGTPMLLMGDEMGRSQGGNNNAYCHDSEMNWLDWSLTRRESDLLSFTRGVIALRHAHAVLRLPSHPRGDRPGSLGFPEISWHGCQPWQPDWASRLVALVFAAETASGPDVVYFAWNSAHLPTWLTLPALPEGWNWTLEANTAQQAHEDVFPPGQGPALDGKPFLLGARSAILLSPKIDA